MRSMGKFLHIGDDDSMTNTLDMNDSISLEVGEAFRFTQVKDKSKILTSPRFIIKRLNSIQFSDVENNVWDGEIVPFKSSFNMTLVNHIRHSQSLENKSSPQISATNYVTEMRYVCTKCNHNDAHFADKTNEKPVCTIRKNELRGSVCHEKTTLWNLEHGYFVGNVTSKFESRIYDMPIVSFDGYDWVIIGMNPLNNRGKKDNKFTYSATSRSVKGVRSLNCGCNNCAVKMTPAHEKKNRTIVGYDKDGNAYVAPRQCHKSPKMIVSDSGLVIKNTEKITCGGELKASFFPSIGFAAVHMTEENLAQINKENRPITDIINVVSGVEE